MLNVHRICKQQHRRWLECCSSWLAQAHSHPESSGVHCKAGLLAALLQCTASAGQTGLAVKADVTLCRAPCTYRMLNAWLKLKQPRHPGRQRQGISLAVQLTPGGAAWGCPLTPGCCPELWPAAFCRHAPNGIHQIRLTNPQGPR